MIHDQTLELTILSLYSSLQRTRLSVLDRLNGVNTAPAPRPTLAYSQPHVSYQNSRVRFSLDNRFFRFHIGILYTNIQ